MTRRRHKVYTWAHRLTPLVFLGVLALGRTNGDLVRGTPGSVRLFDRLPLADPLSALEVVFASRSLPLDLLLGALAITALYALLGRVFCGWLCPLGLVLELEAELGRRRAAASIPRGRIKYVWLAITLLFSGLAAVPLFTTFSPIAALFHLVVFGPGLALFVVGAIAALEWWRPRIFCRSLCPLGAFYALAGRFARLRVALRRRRTCDAMCRLCSSSCPYGIDVIGEIVANGKAALDNPECTRCGICLDHCPPGILGWRV